MVDRRADQGVERMRWLGRGANALTDAMLGADGDAQAAALSDVAELYAPALGLLPRDILSCAQAARTHLSALAQAMGLSVAANAPARRLLQATATSSAADASTVLNADAANPSAAPVARLGDGLVAVKRALADKSLRLNEVLSLVLETVHQALDLRCVVFCLRDPKSGLLLGRAALGKGSADMSMAFRILPDAGAGTDLFAALCAKGADLLVADSKTVASRLPAWYRSRVNGATFLLLPMMVKGQSIGLIYADKAEVGSLKVGEAELSLLRGLRDQAVAAFSKGAA
jgi:hypothetical protein